MLSDIRQAALEFGTEIGGFDRDLDGHARRVSAGGLESDRRHRERFDGTCANAGPPLEQLQGEVTSLTRARDLSERAYKAGAIPLTDVLDADRQLLVARDDVESTRADAARAAVRTFRALGGGWVGHT
jgi:hypothetical protein